MRLTLALLHSELVTLVVRSIFPVHPIAAAIQSIGVCQRDLEGRPEVGIGRIIFPALLLHGSFDFALMLSAFIVGLGNDNDNENTSDQKATISREDVPALVVSFVIMMLGIVYYVLMARAQRKRLVGLDQTRRHNESVAVPRVV